MIRRIGTQRRAEGHLEYIIITSLIMVCALVAFFSMINNIKIIADDLKICSDCPDGKNPADETKPLDVPTVDGQDPANPDTNDNGSSNPQPSPYPNWLADIMSWFSGARWFWDYALA